MALLQLAVHAKRSVTLGYVDAQGTATRRIGEIADEEGLNVLAWRDVPVDASLVGPTARACMPTFKQLVVDPVSVAGGQLEAFDPTTGSVRSFVLHRVSSVALVD